MQSKADLREQRQNEEELRITRMYLQQKSHGMLKRRSVFSEKGVLNHKFNQVDTKDAATKAIVSQTQNIAAAYCKGQTFNTILYGKAGTGKTMLASCLLNKVNDNAITPVSCLFVSVPLLKDLALARVRNQDFQQVERMNQLERSIRDADIVVLDDLGSETSMRTGDIKPANETMQKALFTIADSRVGKATIITTNYSGEDLTAMYNEKIISRLITINPEHLINFDQLPDRRIIQN